MKRQAAPSPGISVVIPVLNAERFLPPLFLALAAQSLKPLEIILVDSGSTDGTRFIAAGHERVRVLSVDDFSHGRARNLGAREARGDIVVFMSQDALPLGERWLEELVTPLLGDGVAAAYSRQIPNQSATPMERFFLHARFPEEGHIRKKTSMNGELTLEDVFFSNVSSAVRKCLLEEHPFDEDLIMSEDQKLSKDLLEEGHTIAYASRSMVMHSHAYKLGEVFKRYLDSAHSLDQIFASHTMKTSASIGLKYLARECRYVARNYPTWIPYYVLYTAAKSLGTITGHWALSMPRMVLKRISLHGYHWDRNEEL